MAATHQHRYSIHVAWTGDRGQGTRSYTVYDRRHEISSAGKPPIPGSSDPSFRGDPTRYNPEELLVASLSGCHMLWFLHLCADAGVVVVGYEDDAEGTMEETGLSGGRFTEVVLRPRVSVRPGADPERLSELHHRAHELCYIASSVAFPVRCEPRPVVEVPAAAG